MILGSVTQPAVKRAAAIALVNCVCNTPNIWTSYLYYDGPRYVAAFAVNLDAALIAIAFATLAWVYLKRENRKIGQGKRLGKSGSRQRQRAAGFRYLL